jgi:hypothetical protein
VAPNGYALDRATVPQKKTARPVRFELTDQTRQAIDESLRLTGLRPGQLLFPGRRDASRGMSGERPAIPASVQHGFEESRNILPQLVATAGTRSPSRNNRWAIALGHLPPQSLRIGNAAPITEQVVVREIIDGLQLGSRLQSAHRAVADGSHVPSVQFSTVQPRNSGAANDGA